MSTNNIFSHILNKDIYDYTDYSTDEEFSFHKFFLNDSAYKSTFNYEEKIPDFNSERHIAPWIKPERNIAFPVNSKRHLALWIKPERNIAFPVNSEQHIDNKNEPNNIYNIIKNKLDDQDSIQNKLNFIKNNLIKYKKLHDSLNECINNLIGDIDLLNSNTIHSILNMIKFLTHPFLYKYIEKLKNFYIDLDHMNIGAIFIGNDSKLNIIFKFDGELFFRFVDLNQGRSRISGTAFFGINNEKTINKLNYILSFIRT